AAIAAESPSYATAPLQRLALSAEEFSGTAMFSPHGTPVSLRFPRVDPGSRHSPLGGSGCPQQRGVAAGRSAVYPEARLAARSGQRGTSGATTGGGGRSAPDTDYVSPDLSYAARKMSSSAGASRLSLRMSSRASESSNP